MVKISSADKATNRELSRDSKIALAILLIIIAYTLVRGCDPPLDRQLKHTMISFDAMRCEVMMNIGGNVRPVKLPLLKPVELAVGADSSVVDSIAGSALATPLELGAPPANTPASYLLADGQELEKLLVAEGLADLADDSAAPAAWKTLRDNARVNRRGLWGLDAD